MSKRTKKFLNRFVFISTLLLLFSICFGIVFAGLTILPNYGGDSFNTGLSSIEQNNVANATVHGKPASFTLDTDLSDALSLNTPENKETYTATNMTANNFSFSTSNISQDSLDKDGNSTSGFTVSKITNGAQLSVDNGGGMFSGRWNISIFTLNFTPEQTILDILNNIPGSKLSIDVSIRVKDHDHAGNNYNEVVGVKFVATPSLLSSSNDAITDVKKFPGADKKKPGYKYTTANQNNWDTITGTGLELNSTNNNLAICIVDGESYGRQNCSFDNIKMSFTLTVPTANIQLYTYVLGNDNSAISIGTSYLSASNLKYTLDKTIVPQDYYFSYWKKDSGVNDKNYPKEFNLKDFTNSTISIYFCKIPIMFNGKGINDYNGDTLSILDSTAQNQSYLSINPNIPNFSGDGYTSEVFYKLLSDSSPGDGALTVPTEVGSYKAKIKVYKNSVECGQITINFDIKPGDFARKDNPSGQWGSINNPYYIQTQQHFDHLIGIVNGTYTPINSTQGSPENIDSLATDIHYDNCYFLLAPGINLVASTPIGNTVSNMFMGIFDGNNNIINLSISKSDDYAGLFGGIDGATIKNVKTTGSVSGRGYVGGIVGYSLNSSTITNCFNSATVTSTSSVSSTIDGASVNGSFTGGICGYFNEGTINHCLNNANVQGQGYAGGIAGQSSGNISYCVNKGNISTGNFVAGLVGHNSNGIGEYLYNIGGTISGNNNINTVANGYADETKLWYIGNATSVISPNRIYTDTEVSSIKPNVAGTTAETVTQWEDILIKNINVFIIEIIGKDKVVNLSSDKLYKGYEKINGYKDLGNVTIDQVEYPKFEVHYNANGPIELYYDFDQPAQEKLYDGKAYQLSSTKSWSYTILGKRPSDNSYIDIVDAGTYSAIITASEGDKVLGKTTKTIEIKPIDLTYAVAGIVKDGLEKNNNCKDFTQNNMYYSLSKVDATEDLSVFKFVESIMSNAVSYKFYYVNNGDTLELKTEFYTFNVINTANGLNTITISANNENVINSINFYYLAYESDFGTKSGTGDWGSENNPFIIESEQHLNNLYDILYGNRHPLDSVSDSNISFSGKWFNFTYLNITQPIGKDGYPFKGSVDGEGQTFNLTFDLTTNYVGLFGYAVDSTLKRIKITGIIKGKGADYVGGLVGKIENGTISHCYNSATVTGTTYVGGIAGQSSGNISYCVNDGAISGNYAAGLVGQSTSGTGEYLYNIGGAVTGTNTNTVANGYANEAKLWYIGNTTAITSPNHIYTTEVSSIKPNVSGTTAATEVQWGDILNKNINVFIIQIIGTDKVVNLSSDKLYKGYETNGYTQLDNEIIDQVEYPKFEVHYNANGPITLYYNFDKPQNRQYNGQKYKYKSSNSGIYSYDVKDSNAKDIINAGTYNNVIIEAKNNNGVLLGKTHQYSITISSIELSTAIGGIKKSNLYALNTTNFSQNANYFNMPNTNANLPVFVYDTTIMNSDASYIFYAQSNGKLIELKAKDFILVINVVEANLSTITLSPKNSRNLNGSITFYYNTRKSDFGYKDETNKVNWGSEENPYVIKNSEHFTNLYQIFYGEKAPINSVDGSNLSFSGKWILIDVDGLSTTKALGYNGNPFKGNIDGGSKSIALNIVGSDLDYLGFLGYAEGSTIKNLTVTGIVTGKLYVGGIVGKITGSGEIKSCTNKAKITGTNEVGGICGASGSKVTSCKNTGVINGTKNAASGYVGGIVGQLLANVAINSCENLATGTVNGGQYTGGILGSPSSGGNGSLSNNKNYATISSEHDSVGGIVGWFNKNITKCENHGSVSSTSNSVGGIVGNYTAGEVKECKNSANVSSSGGAVGGIVGNASAGKAINQDGISSTTTITKITDCINEFTASEKQSVNIKGAWAVGGIVGRAIGTTVSGCKNTGYVASTSSYHHLDNEGHVAEVIANYNIRCAYLGGIAGLATARAKINNCYNNGPVATVNGSGQKSRYDYSDAVSGVVGYLRGSASYCYNSGAIYGSSEVGTVIGWLEPHGWTDEWKDDSTCLFNEGTNSNGGDWSNTVVGYQRHSGRLSVVWQLHTDNVTKDDVKFNLSNAWEIGNVYPAIQGSKTIYKSWQDICSNDINAVRVEYKVQDHKNNYIDLTEKSYYYHGADETDINGKKYYDVNESINQYNIRISLFYNGTTAADSKYIKAFNENLSESKAYDGKPFTYIETSQGVTSYKIVHNGNILLDAGTYNNSTIKALNGNNIVGIKTVNAKINEVKLVGSNIKIDGNPTYNGKDQILQFRIVITNGNVVETWTFIGNTKQSYVKKDGNQVITQDENRYKSMFQVTGGYSYKIVQSYTLQITTSGNFTGNFSFDWSPSPYTIKSSEITIKDDLTYNGNNQYVHLMVDVLGTKHEYKNGTWTHNGKLNENVLSIDSGHYGTDAGNYKVYLVTPTNNPNYTFTRDGFDWEIHKAVFSEFTFTSQPSDLVYNFESQAPNFTVSWKDKTWIYEYDLSNHAYNEPTGTHNLTDKFIFEIIANNLVNDLPTYPTYVGNYTIKIKGKSNQTNFKFADGTSEYVELSDPWQITQLEINSNNFSVASQSYSETTYNTDYQGPNFDLKLNSTKKIIWSFALANNKYNNYEGLLVVINGDNPDNNDIPRNADTYTVTIDLNGINQNLIACSDPNKKISLSYTISKKDISELKAYMSQEIGNSLADTKSYTTIDNQKVDNSLMYVLSKNDVTEKSILWEGWFLNDANKFDISKVLTQIVFLHGMDEGHLKQLDPNLDLKYQVAIAGGQSDLQSYNNYEISGDGNYTGTYIVSFDVLKSDFESGTGEIGNPYIIKYKQQLIRLAELTNGHSYNGKALITQAFGTNITYPKGFDGVYFKLSDDLVTDLEVNYKDGFRPIGNVDSPFFGNFNGNSKTLKLNLVSKTNGSIGNYAGLFGVVGAQNKYPVLQNVTLKGTIIGDKYVGGLVGLMQTGNISGDIKFMDSTSKVTGNSNVGGLFGIIKSDSGIIYQQYRYFGSVTDARDINGDRAILRNEAIVNANSDYVGGIVGSLSNTNGVSMIFNAICQNSGNINGSVDSSSYVGGLIGASDASIKIDWHPLVKNGSVYISYNGIVSNISNTIKGKQNVGGLIGSLGNAAHEIKQVYNYCSNITGSENVGGIVGIMNQGQITDSISVPVGQVLKTTNMFVNCGNNVGGIVGDFKGGKIQDTYSIGTLLDQTSLTIGGIVGQRSAQGQVIDCWTIYVVGNDVEGEPIPEGYKKVSKNTKTENGTDGKYIIIEDDYANLPTLYDLLDSIGIKNQNSNQILYTQGDSLTPKRKFRFEISVPNTRKQIVFYDCSGFEQFNQDIVLKTPTNDYELNLENQYWPIVAANNATRDKIIMSFKNSFSTKVGIFATEAKFNDIPLIPKPTDWATYYVTPCADTNNNYLVQGIEEVATGDAHKYKINGNIVFNWNIDGRDTNFKLHEIVSTRIWVGQALDLDAKVPRTLYDELPEGAPIKEGESRIPPVIKLLGDNENFPNISGDSWNDLFRNLRSTYNNGRTIPTEVFFRISEAYFTDANGQKSKKSYGSYWFYDYGESSVTQEKSHEIFATRRWEGNEIDLDATKPDSGEFHLYDNLSDADPIFGNETIAAPHITLSNGTTSLLNLSGKTWGEILLKLKSDPNVKVKYIEKTVKVQNPNAPQGEMIDKTYGSYWIIEGEESDFVKRSVLVGRLNNYEYSISQGLAPLVIKTQGEWNHFANEVATGASTYEGWTVKLGENIVDNTDGKITYTLDGNTKNWDLNSTKIYVDNSNICGVVNSADTTHRFMGTFDGNGKTIYVNIDYADSPGVSNVSLFPNAGGFTFPGVIKNLNIAGQVITHCEISGGSSSNASTQNITGGHNVAAFVSNPKDTLNMYNCNNYATVWGKSNVAGLISRCERTTKVEIIDCINQGDIVSTVDYNWQYNSANESNTSNYGTGGIIGSIGAGQSIKLDSCKNLGNIRAASNVGGIVGCNCSDLTITNSANEGEIRGQRLPSFKTDLYGKDTKIIKEHTYTVQGSSVQGYIDDYHRNHISAVGGILGTNSIENGQGGAIKAYACYNKGDIIAGCLVAGGIIGADTQVSTTYYNKGSSFSSVSATQNSARTKIKYCYNQGNIYTGSKAKTKPRAGEATRDINDVINRQFSENNLLTFTCDVFRCGEDQDTGGLAGGILGASTNIIVSDCYNTGELVSNGVLCAALVMYNIAVGGVLGYVVAEGGNNHVYVTRCYNIGQIYLSYCWAQWTGGSVIGNLPEDRRYAANIIGCTATKTCNDNNVYCENNIGIHNVILDAYKNVRYDYKLGYNGGLNDQGGGYYRSGTLINSIADLCGALDSSTGKIAPSTTTTKILGNASSSLLVNSTGNREYTTIDDIINYENNLDESTNEKIIANLTNSKKAFVYPYGSLPQLAIFALGTETGLSMLSSTYNKDQYHDFIKVQAGNELSPYLINDGVDLLCFEALTNATDGGAHWSGNNSLQDCKYIEFANSTNNIYGNIAQDIAMPIETLSREEWYKSTGKVIQEEHQTIVGKNPNHVEIVGIKGQYLPPKDYVNKDKVSNLIDGVVETKYAPGSDNFNVILDAGREINLYELVLITGKDIQDYPKRNLQSMSIYGSNNAGLYNNSDYGPSTWQIIKSFDNLQMHDIQYWAHSYFFKDNEASYRYYLIRGIGEYDSKDIITEISEVVLYEKGTFETIFDVEKDYNNRNTNHTLFEKGKYLGHEYQNVNITGLLAQHESSNTAEGSNKLIDGKYRNDATKYCLERSDYNIKFQLANSTILNEIVWITGNDTSTNGGRNLKSMTVYGTNDDTLYSNGAYTINGWTEIKNFPDMKMDIFDLYGYSYELDNTNSYKYYMILANNKSGTHTQMSELLVYSKYIDQSNIDINMFPISKEENFGFAGVLDGSLNSAGLKANINNLNMTSTNYYNMGLFSEVNGGTLSNFVINGTVTSGKVKDAVDTRPTTVGLFAGSTYSGAQLIGLEAGSTTGKAIVGTSETNEDFWVGGIVGHVGARENNTVSKIVDCKIVDAEIKGNTNTAGATGGIVGVVKEDINTVGKHVTSVEISGCSVNKLDMYSTGSHAFHMGAILGDVLNNIINDNGEEVTYKVDLMIRNCAVGQTSSLVPVDISNLNNVNVLIKGEHSLGGIVSRVHDNVRIDNSSVYGDVLIAREHKGVRAGLTSSEYGTNIGGIVGYTLGSAAFTNNISFYGTIDVTNQTTAITNIGGIVGASILENGYGAYFNGVTTNMDGDIKASQEENKAIKENIGGFAGLANAGVFDGEFSINPDIYAPAFDNVGGFIGHSYLAGDVKSNVYIANVDKDNPKTINIGHLNNGVLTRGNIVGNHNVGGFIGNNAGNLYIGEVNVNLTYYYGKVLLNNHANIDGKENVGGIVGINNTTGYIQTGHHIMSIDPTAIIENGGQVGTKNESYDTDDSDGYLRTRYFGGLVGNNAGNFDITSKSQLSNDKRVGISYIEYNGQYVGHSDTHQNFVGGLIGISTGGLTVNTDLQNTKNGKVYGTSSIGGIVGSVENGAISGSITNAGSVHGFNAVGGFTGIIGENGKITNIDDTHPTTITNTGKVIANKFDTKKIPGDGSEITDAEDYVLDKIANRYVGGGIGIFNGSIGFKNDEGIDKTGFAVKFINEGGIDAYSYAGGSIGVLAGTLKNASFSHTGNLSLQGDEALGGSIGAILDNIPGTQLDATQPTKVLNSYFEYLNTNSSSRSVFEAGLGLKGTIGSDKGGIGGVIGLIDAPQMGSASDWTNNRFYINGDVKAAGCQNVGGVVGKISENSYVTIKNMLALDNEVVGAKNVGGIVGYNSSKNTGTGEDASLVDCYNIRGTVKREPASTTPVSYTNADVGGIVGKAKVVRTQSGEFASGPVTYSCYWFNGFNNKILENVDITNLGATLVMTEVLVYEVDKINTPEYEQVRKDIETKGFLIDNKYNIDAYVNGSKNGTNEVAPVAEGEQKEPYNILLPNGQRLSDSIKVQKQDDGNYVYFEATGDAFSTGQQETGWFCVYANDVSDPKSNFKGNINVAHTIEGYGATPQQQQDYMAWRHIANAYQEGDTILKDLKSNLINPNKKGIDKCVTRRSFYATAQGAQAKGDVSGYYLFGAVSGVEGDISFDTDTFYFHANFAELKEDGTPVDLGKQTKNIVLYYKKAIPNTNKDIVYNGMQRYTPTSLVYEKGNNRIEKVGVFGVPSVEDVPLGNYYLHLTDSNTHNVGINAGDKYTTQADIMFRYALGPDQQVLDQKVGVINGTKDYNWSIKKRDITVKSKLDNKGSFKYGPQKFTVQYSGTEHYVNTEVGNILVSSGLTTNATIDSAPQTNGYSQYTSSADADICNTVTPVNQINLQKKNYRISRTDLGNTTLNITVDGDTSNYNVSSPYNIILDIVQSEVKLTWEGGECSYIWDSTELPKIQSISLTNVSGTYEPTSVSGNTYTFKLDEKRTITIIVTGNRSTNGAPGKYIATASMFNSGNFTFDQPKYDIAYKVDKATIASSDGIQINITKDISKIYDGATDYPDNNGVKNNSNLTHVKSSNAVGHSGYLSNYLGGITYTITSVTFDNANVQTDKHDVTITGTYDAKGSSYFKGTGNFTQTIKCGVITPIKVSATIEMTTPNTYEYTYAYKHQGIKTISITNNTGEVFEFKVVVLNGTTPVFEKSGAETTITVANCINVGEYKAEISIVGNNNYIVDTDNLQGITWTINKATIEFPTDKITDLDSIYTYNRAHQGMTKVPVEIDGINNGQQTDKVALKYTVSGTGLTVDASGNVTGAINVGSYSLIPKSNNTNYDVTSKTYSWKINKFVIQITPTGATGTTAFDNTTHGITMLSGNFSALLQGSENFESFITVTLTNLTGSSTANDVIYTIPGVKNANTYKVQLALNTSLDIKDNLTYAGETFTWTISKRVVTISTITGTPGKVYDGNADFGTWSGTETETQSDVYENDRGFKVTGYEADDKPISIVATFVEKGTDRSKFDAYVNGVVIDTNGIYSIDSTKKNDKVVRFVLTYDTDDGVDNYEFTGLQDRPAEITQKKVKATYKNTNQSYINEDGTLKKYENESSLAQWKSIEGTLTGLVNNDKVALAISNEWMRHTYYKDQVVRVNATLVPKDNDTTGRYINYNLMTIPTLIIAYFTKETGDVISTISGLLIASYYYSLNFKDKLGSGETIEVTEQIGITEDGKYYYFPTSFDPNAPAGDNNQGFKIDKTESFETDLALFKTAFDTYFNSIKDASETLTGEDTWELNVQDKAFTYKVNYKLTPKNEFTLNNNISGILNKDDLDILNARFGNGNWGKGKTYLTNVLLAQVNKKLVLDTSLFDHTFVGKIQADSYIISDIIVRVTHTDATAKNIGLFGAVANTVETINGGSLTSQTTINNLHIRNVDIQVVGAGSGTINVGGVVGLNEGVALTNISYLGNINITATNATANVGGIVGNVTGDVAIAQVMSIGRFRLRVKDGNIGTTVGSMTVGTLDNVLHMVEIVATGAAGTNVGEFIGFVGESGIVPTKAQGIKNSIVKNDKLQANSKSTKTFEDLYMNSVVVDYNNWDKAWGSSDILLHIEKGVFDKQGKNNRSITFIDTVRDYLLGYNWTVNENNEAVHNTTKLPIVETVGTDGKLTKFNVVVNNEDKFALIKTLWFMTFDIQCTLDLTNNPSYNTPINSIFAGKFIGTNIIINTELFKWNLNANIGITTTVAQQ